MSRNPLTTGILAIVLALVLSACGGGGTPYSPLPPMDEGSVAAPVSIALDSGGNAIWSGQVGLTNSYYVINGVAPVEYHHVSLTLISNDVDLYIYNSPGFTDYLGGSSNPGTDGESAIVNTTGTELYIRVRSFDAPDGAMFLLSVDHKPLVDEGTALSPVSLQNSAGKVGTVGVANSYYSIGVAPGVLEVTLEGNEGGPDVVYYDDDASFVSARYRCTGDPLRCLVTASSSTAYLLVDGSGTSSGDVYDIAVKPYDGQVEGTPDAPVPLILDTPYGGAVYNSSIDSYYRVGVTSGTSYEVSLTGLSADADLYVYNSPGFSSVPCYNYMTGTTPEFCTVSATGPMLYMRVQNWSDPATVTYILNTTAN